MDEESEVLPIHSSVVMSRSSASSQVTSKKGSVVKKDETLVVLFNTVLGPHFFPPGKFELFVAPHQQLRSWM